MEFSVKIAFCEAFFVEAKRRQIDINFVFSQDLSGMIVYYSFVEKVITNKWRK